MRIFIALVEQEGDSAHGISFPDLPGCFSAADSLEDVIPKATEALQLWFEDMPEASPSPVHEIRVAVADQLACGGFLIAVPLVQTDAS